MTRRIKVPLDFPVQPLKPGAKAKDRVTCGTCGLSWDDAIVTSYTPTPSARCPFEEFHKRTSRDLRSSGSSRPPRPVQFEGHAREVTVASSFHEPLRVSVRDPGKGRGAVYYELVGPGGGTMVDSYGMLAMYPSRERAEQELAKMGTRGVRIVKKHNPAPARDPAGKRHVIGNIWGHVIEWDGHSVWIDGKKSPVPTMSGSSVKTAMATAESYLRTVGSMQKRTRSQNDPGRRGHRTQSEHLASIEWNIKDAKEALTNAVGMNDWRGVAKYTKQIEVLEQKYRKSEHPSMKRSRGRGMQSKFIAGHRFGRGELPGGAPSKRYEIQGASGETLWNVATRKPQTFYSRAKAEAAFAKLREEHGPLPSGVRIIELTGPESPPHPQRDFGSFALGAAVGAGGLYAGQRIMARPKAKAVVRLGRIKTRRAAKSGARGVGQSLTAWGSRDPSDLSVQNEEHRRHPPRIRKVGSHFIVEIYSPVRHGYIIGAEHSSNASALRDLINWKNSYNAERESFRRTGYRDPGGPKSGRRAVAKRVDTFSETMHEANEIARFRKELAQAGKGASREEKAAFAEALAHDPELVAERIDWILAGHYGQGAYLEARKTIRGRSNAPAWLTQVVGAIEWGVPFASTRRIFTKLSNAQKSALARHVDKVISSHLNR